MPVSIAEAEAERVFGDGVEDAAPVSAQNRISSLDFIRGIAVMGILAANIVSFGQPFSAYMWPSAWIGESGDPDGWMWIAQFILIDGKMRGLFTLLFGAGMYLFMERAWARGSTRRLQLWRLFLLFVFGMIHFTFIWLGDILAMYAVIGFIAVACMRWEAGTQMRVGLFGYILGAIFFAGLMSSSFLIAETDFGAAEGLAEVRQGMIAAKEKSVADDLQTAAMKQSGDYAGIVQKRITKELVMPLSNSLFFILETLPLMLIGMALYRFGFFSGAFSASRMRLWGWLGVVGGAALSLGIGLFVKSSGFGFYATTAAFMGWSQIPRLMMVLGIAALLVEYSKVATGWFGERVSAAGRMAFTNYLGTSVLMLFVFHGWALGLFGQLNRPELYIVTVCVWVLMLGLSKPWLERFRYGPLEWLWRCLTYRTFFPLRR